MPGLKVRGDGNGGFDVNVQKAVLRRWGPLGLAILFVLSGLGSRFGDELWAIITDRQRISAQVEINSEDIQANTAAMVELRREIRSDLSEIRASVDRMETLILDHVVEDDKQGDK